MKIGASLRSAYPPMDVRTGARWMIERARAAADAGLDSLFVGDHHNVPVPYYQNVPMLGRLLAEWDDRPAGALFLLPLWHPVLLAEQIGTLASIAAGPFIMQCAVGGGAEQFDALGVPIRAAPVAVRSRARHRPPPVRRRRGQHRIAVRDRAGAASRRSPRSRSRCGSARPRRRPSIAPPARRRLAHRTGSDARAGPRARRPSTARRATVTAARRGTIAIRRDVHVGARRRRRRHGSPVRSSTRGYRGFDPAAPVVGGRRARGGGVRRPRRGGLHRRDHPPPRRRPGRSAGVVRSTSVPCGAR